MTDQEAEMHRRAVRDLREERDRYRNALMNIVNYAITNDGTTRPGYEFVQQVASAALTSE